MTKPTRAKVAPIRMSLSMTALEHTVSMLPPARHYRVEVGALNARYADTVIREIRQLVEPNPLAPTLGLEVNPTFTDVEWSIWSGDDCLWNEGV